jgi:hypothetical protein
MSFLERRDAILTPWLYPDEKTDKPARMGILEGRKTNPFSFPHPLK